ncbi:hypothetical protein MNBD_CHLOROFLEXI01-2175 [hydrothermal vent metagenome]|uniref:Uncharacterized protein n=1 Tax=hydrothermal vent metagenome TaxID=652676 RepID=A0A3B0VH78_9ZZZZ
MNKEAQRRYYILSIWSQASGSSHGVWRGYLESASGSRAYFATLQRLNNLLQSVGWQDDTAVTEPKSPFV